MSPNDRTRSPAPSPVEARQEGRADRRKGAHGVPHGETAEGTREEGRGGAVGKEGGAMTPRLGPLMGKLIFEGMLFAREAIYFWYTEAEIKQMDIPTRERIERDTVFLKFMPMLAKKLKSMLKAEDVLLFENILAVDPQKSSPLHAAEADLLDRYTLAIKIAVDESKAECLREMKLR